jgi:hypothetical protein
MSDLWSYKMVIVPSAEKLTAAGFKKIPFVRTDSAGQLPPGLLIISGKKDLAYF